MKKLAFVSLLFILLVVSCHFLPENERVTNIKELVISGDFNEAYDKSQLIKVGKLTKSEKAEYYAIVGEIHLGLEEHDQAFKAYNEGLKIFTPEDSDPQVMNLLYGLAKTSRQSGNKIAALKYAKKLRSQALLSKDSVLLYKSNTILGNVFLDLKQIDSVFIYYEEAKRYINSEKFRSLAILENNLGNMELLFGTDRNALLRFKKSSQLFAKNNDKYNQMNPLIGMSVPMANMGNSSAALRLLDSLEQIAHENNWIEHKASIFNARFEIRAKEFGIQELLELKDSIGTYGHIIFDSNLANSESKWQNDRLEWQLARRKSNMRSLLIVLITGLLLSIIYFYNLRLKSRLKLQEAELKRQQELEQERTRIAAEMHDDLGGGLSRIKFLSQKVKRNSKNESQSVLVDKITGQSTELIGNMSEIIWAMNASFDTWKSLMAYIRRYASSYLSEHEIEFVFQSKEAGNDYTISGEKRREIYLIVKEAIHNVVKHANASTVNIIVEIEEHIKIEIKDNGRGMDGFGQEFGYGLTNMKNRAHKLEGVVEFKNQAGTTIILTFPKQILTEMKPSIT